MTDDDVGSEPFPSQAFAQPSNSEAVHDRAIDLVHVGLRRGQDRCREIFEHANAGDLVIPALRNEHDGMPSFLEVPHDVNMLAGKVLMDEQELHRAPTLKN